MVCGLYFNNIVAKVICYKPDMTARVFSEEK
jgi:hypothetical protein